MSMCFFQLSIREYIFRIVPRRTVNFRIAPATKVTIKCYEGNVPILSIKDSFQNK